MLPEVVQRMIVESSELGEKTERASAFTLTETFKHLPDAEQNVFLEQIHYMREYKRVLDMRTEMIKERVK